jgi:non-canonical (house-cleaning) NTP pyrophosphatase
MNSLVCEPKADLHIGIEGGLVQRYGEWFEEVWVVALKREKLKPDEAVVKTFLPHKAGFCKVLESL